MDRSSISRVRARCRNSNTSVFVTQQKPLVMRARDAVSYVVTEYTLLTPSGVSGTLWNSGATASSLTNVYMLVLTQNFWQVSFSGAATDTDTVSVANSLVRCVPVMHGVSDDGHQYCVPL